jgi:hypothetical protein
MPCNFVCDECGRKELGVHVKDYVFSKPRTWFQRSIKGPGPRTGETIEVKCLIACSHECMEKLNEKHPLATVTLEVVK